MREVLRIDAVHLRRGTRPILRGVSIEVARGELVALMGPSGSGKTTVLRAAAGLESFEAGRIVVDGVSLDGGAPVETATLRQLRRKIGMVFQFCCLFEHLSALDNAIARALAVDPPVLLMDEPTASLDPARRGELGELLHGLLRQGRTLVVATHDEEFARAWATQVVRLRDGVIE